MTDSITPTHTDWIGRTVLDHNGDKVGDITDIYYDDRTGRPEWKTVATGWFGTKEQFVPISGSAAHGDDIRVNYDTDLIKHAPSTDDSDAHLSEAEERRLYSHYGFNAEGTDEETLYGQRDRADEGYEYYDRRAVERTAGEAAEMTLSEEELSVNKTQHQAGRVRLHKYVVTEDVHVTVPVKKQVARLVREPLTGVAAEGSAFEEFDEKVTLMEEEVEVSKRAVAKERVGLEVDEVTEERIIDETARKEQVEVDGDVAR